MSRRAELLKKAGYGTIGFLLFIAIWQGLADLVVKSELFFPSFSTVIGAAANSIDTLVLLRQLTITMRNFGIGMVLSLALAIPVGFAFGWYAKVRQIFGPLMSALYVAPLVAILPAIILLFGVYDESKIVLVVLAAFFPLAINIESGVRNVDQSLVEMARSFGASDGQIFTSIAIQNSVPYALAGLRLAIGRGLAFAILAEMFASTNGIGHLITLYASTFEMAQMFVPVLVIVVVAIIMIGLVQVAESRFQSWRPVRAA